MIHFKDNKNKSALSTRWAQMSKQEQIIEKKKMEIQAKLEAQKQAAALAAQAKLSNPTAKEETGSPNIFSNDGSFMSQYKALLERQSKDKQEKEVKEKQELDDVKNIKTEFNQKPLAPIQKEVIEDEESSCQASAIKPERGPREIHRRWNERGRNRPRSPMTPVVEDRKKMLDSSNIPPLMQLTVQPPNNHSPPPNAHNQWNSHDGNSSNDEYDYDRQHGDSFDNQDSDSGQMGSDQMSLLGPGPMGPGSMISGPLCPNQIGPGPMCPGPMGHGSMGPGPMRPGPMGPGPMGPGPMGPGPMGPGLMGHGPMGPGPMGPRPLMPGLLGPGPMGPGPMGPGPMGFGPMGPRHMGPGPMGPGPMGPGPMGSGPMGPGPMGPGPMGPGPMGPGPMGPGPMGPGPMGPGPMGPGPIGLGPMAPGPMGPGNICSGPLLSGPMGPNPGTGTGLKMGPGSLLGPGPNMSPSPNMPPGGKITSGPNMPPSSNIPPAPNMPSGSNIPPGSNLPPESNMPPVSNVAPVSNIPPGTNIPSGPNMPPGPNMPSIPNMAPGPNMPPGPNMSPGPNMPLRPPVPPYMGGPPNFPMPPNFMGPNGPVPLPPNMCGPDVRGTGLNGPIRPFFPPFPNSQMSGSNGPPNSMMPPNSMNPPMVPGGSTFGPQPPFGPAHNFGPNNNRPPNIGPPNMPFMPPSSMPPNSSNTIPELKPSDIPPADTMKLQNIPPPPIPLNNIPKPKDLEPPTTPALPNSSQVLSADTFPPTVLRAAAEVATNGDHWENVLKAIHSQDQNLWFLHNPNSNEYKAYRSVVCKMRNDCAMEKKRDVKPEDKYEPEFCLEDEDSNEHDRTIKEENNRFSMQDPYCNKYHMMKREQGSSQSDDDSDNKSDRRKRRKSRWGNDPPVDIKPPGIVAPLPNTIPGASLSKIDEDGLKLTNINRNNQALMQYAMTNYGTTNLNAEDWKKCEDNFKLNLLYQDMLKKRQEVERLANAGKNKYEYDSDEDTSEGTWEHKLRAKEMNATERWATELTKQAAGKHHIGDFLPPEELKKFMEKYSAFKSGKEPDLSDYKEYKLKEDNVGFKMLQKLGWNEGQGLGAEGTGIVDPINKANQPVANLGLGASTSDVVSADDDEFDAYRKRMMLAYRFRPNPLNNPRRPYY